MVRKGIGSDNQYKLYKKRRRANNQYRYHLNFAKKGELIRALAYIFFMHSANAFTIHNYC